MAKKAPNKRPPLTAPKPPPRRPGGSAWPLVGTAGRGLLALGLIAGTMALVVWVGGRAGHGVAPNARYTVAFEKINVPPPPRHLGQFLTEVRYLSNLPETFQSVDPNLRPTLTAAFARHPWVKQVDGVDVGPDGSVRVQLQYRTPVLAVTVKPKAKGDPDRVCVDRSGVILPDKVPHADQLCVLVPPQPPPVQHPGEVWTSETVVKAASFAATNRPKRIERLTAKWKLEYADGRRPDEFPDEVLDKPLR